MTPGEKRAVQIRATADAMNMRGDDRATLEGYLRGGMYSSAEGLIWDSAEEDSDAEIDDWEPSDDDA